MAEIVKVNKERLEELVLAEATLDALEAAGVDNWEGYEFAEYPTDEEVSKAVEHIISKAEA